MVMKIQMNILLVGSLSVLLNQSLLEGLLCQQKSCRNSLIGTVTWSTSTRNYIL